MHKKNIIALAIIALLVFLNCVGNGFVGDDEILFVKNPFFRSWANFPKIFTSEYTADQEAIFNEQKEGMNSGSVAYRPVLSASFFLDYWLWKDKPFGYHAQNVLIHIINTALVYFFIFFIMKDKAVAFISALLFCVHPLRSEAVASIGYRADSLAALFVLAALLCYGHYRESSRRSSYFLSHVLFFLSVFTKESAVVYPGLIISFDWLIRKEEPRDILKHALSRYTGFVLILAFYLYVYINIFPNPSFEGGISSLANSIKLQAVTIFHIFSHYLEVFLFPFLVKQLPPLYEPPIEALWGVKTWLSLGVFFGFIFCVFQAYKRDRKLSFFLLWFLICFIPVSNIIVIANPMAYRFMYLPSIGLSAALVILCVKLKDRVAFFKIYHRVPKMIATGYIVLCVILTVLLNFNWRDNTMMAFAMVKDFPDYPITNLHAGMEYLNAGMTEEAKKLVHKSVKLGVQDPRGYYLMGLLSNDLNTAQAYLEESVRAFPTYSDSYLVLGRIHLIKKEFPQARHYLDKSIQLAPRWIAFAYLIHMHLLEKEHIQAQELMERAEELLAPAEYEQLRRAYSLLQKDPNDLPVEFPDISSFVSH
ncbi:MAG TPA: hypothetical protein VI749_09060 [Candidatus Omnitrophota bacterium]|nr:hypothetical protein [Candidatus Omnitrophota bacterium]